MATILLLSGPNLNLLGAREPQHYGTTTLAELVALASETAAKLGHDIEHVQSNHEGALIDAIHDARGRCDDADPGQAFFGFLGRIREEAAAKRDLPEAIALAGPLQDDLHAALDALLRRAQQAGAVRPEITTPDIIVLLKGLLRSINDAPPGPESQALAERLLTVVTDGLRPHP